MRILVLAMVVVFMFGTAATAAELLLNPDMETWTGTATANYWAFYVAGTAGNDAKSVAFQGSTSTLSVPSPKYVSTVQSQAVDVIYHGKVWSHAGVRQVVATTPGQKYLVSTWIAATNYGWDPVVTNLKEGWLGVENGSLLKPTWSLFTGAENANWASWVMSEGTWQQRSLEFTATGTAITVFLDGYHATNVSNSTKNIRVFFDDASVAAIPEPGSVIAILSGLVGLVGCGVRRRK